MLINCPHCKKPVSDKAATCIHCNGALSVRQTSTNYAIDYTSLSKDQKKLLEKDFVSQQPKKGEAIRVRKLLFVLTIALISVGLLLCIIGLVIMALAPHSEAIVPVMSVGIAVAAVGYIMVIGAVVTFVVNKCRNNKLLLSYKHYEKWLAAKGIGNFCIPIKGARLRQQYENIEIE